jgi:hypothetical protein
MTPQERELLRKAKILELGRVLKQSSDTIIRKINNTIDGKLDDRVKVAYWTSQIKGIREVYKIINDNFDEWIRGEMNTYYESAYKMAENIMRRGGITKAGNIPYKGRILDALINDTVTKFTGAVEGGIGRVNTLFREVQTSSITEAQINRAIAEGLVTDATPQRIRSNLEKQLYKSIVGEEKILAGTKTYKVNTYAEMLARTRTRDAQSSATITASLDYGVDLVQVSDHNTTTPLCMQFEGQIYSITGANKRYPKLEEVAPFHPNCLHVILPLPIADEEDERAISQEAREIFQRNQLKRQAVA